jgi:hypothetical protein
MMDGTIKLDQRKQDKLQWLKDPKKYIWII